MKKEKTNYIDIHARYDCYWIVVKKGWRAGKQTFGAKLLNAAAWICKKEAGEQAFQPAATVDCEGTAERVRQINREEQAERADEEDESGQVRREIR